MAEQAPLSCFPINAIASISGVQLNCSCVKRDQRSIQHQPCDASGKQIAAGALKDSGIGDLDHPLAPPALALGLSRTRKQTQPLACLLGVIQEAQFWKLLEGPGIQLDHLVDKHIGAVREQIDTERLRLIQRSITEVANTDEGHELCEGLSDADVVVFVELFFSVIAEIISVIKGQTAFITREGFILGLLLWGCNSRGLRFSLNDGLDRGEAVVPLRRVAFSAA